MTDERGDQEERQPPVPYEPGPGYEWVAATDTDWTTDPASVIGRRCRFMSARRGHGVPAAAVLFRGRHRTRPYGYCAEHLYGRWIEDGRVMSWRLRVAGEQP